MLFKTVTFHGSLLDVDGMPSTLHCYWIITSNAAEIDVVYKGEVRAAVFSPTGSPVPDPHGFFGHTQNNAIDAAMDILRALPHVLGLTEVISSV
jgi:hypothetical protein